MDLKPSHLRHVKRLFLFFGFLLLISTTLPSCFTGDDGACAVIFSNETSGEEVSLNSGSFTGDELAQSFQLSSATSISAVQLKLKMIGTIPNQDINYIQVKIVDDSSGVPSSTLSDSDSSKSILINQLGLTVGTASFIKFSFANTFSLPADTYWLRLYASYPASAVNTIQWMGYSGNDGYDDGSAYYETNATPFWSNSIFGIFKDFEFYIGC